MSKTVFRYDRGELRKAERTPQGFLKVEGRVARVGVYEYRRDDGTIQRELRPPEEVFSPRALASYEGAPITLGHPRRADGELEDVTASNVKQHEVGTVLGPARQDGDYVVATLLIKDADAIKRVEAGQQELSPGYRIRLDETSGIDPKYGRYDAVQRGHEINHQAVVGRARGGGDIRLRLDDAELILRADGELTAAARHHLPGSMFAVPEHEGLPLENAAHVRDAMARFNQEKFASDAEKRTAYRKILARAKDLDIDASKFAEEHRSDSNVRLTTIADGHQHSIDLDGSWSPWSAGSPMAGSTSYATATGKEHGHTHDWIRNQDGTVTIAMSEDHTHGILDEDGRTMTGLVITPASRGDSHFDQSTHPHDRGPMATTQTGSAPPPDAAEQIRLLTVRADEADRAVSEQRSRADALAADRDGLRAELNTVKERLRETEAKLNAGASAVETAAVLEQRRRADAAERENTRLRDSIPAQVRQRASLVSKATAVLPTIRCDGLTDREILTQAIRHLVPKEPTGSDVSDDYLRRRFDALLDDRAAYGASLSRASQTLSVRNDAPVRQPAQQQRADQLPWADSWKGGVGEYATNHKGG